MSKRDTEYFRRMCRIDGSRPTARDRWQALHRLWRIASRRGMHQDNAVAECFRVLCDDWRITHLLDGPDTDGLVDRSRLPLFLRKELLQIKQRQRLYRGHYEWQERDKEIARYVRDTDGIEVTPLEVAEVRRKIINLARAKAAELDLEMPKDDDELLRMLAGHDRT